MAAALYLLLLGLPSFSAKSQGIIIVRGGVVHRQPQDNALEQIHFDGLNSPKEQAILKLENNATITIRDKIEVDMPVNQAVISGAGYIKGGDGQLEIDVKKPYKDEKAPSRLVIDRNIRFIENTNLVKTGAGALHLNGSEEWVHRFGQIDVTQGIFALGSAHISVTGPITVGPNAIFVIQSYSFEQLRRQRIIKAGGGLADLKLRGDSRGAAHLEFVKTTSADVAAQGLNSLTIENKAAVDFRNSAAETPLVLYLDQLIFNDASSKLEISGWISGVSYLLVKKEWGDARIDELLSHIYFQGQGWATSWEPHDLEDFDDYWQIRPYATPEPATYGTILSAMGIGLWFRQRRGRR